MGAFPWVVLFCLLLCPDCPYIMQSGVNRVQVVFSGFIKRLFCFGLSMQKLYVGMVVCISWLHSYCVCVEVTVMSSA